MKYFDEESIMRKLEVLTPKAGLIFASCCAARLLSAVREYLRVTSAPIDIGIFQEALELIWTFVLDNTVQLENAKKLHDFILEHMPSEDSPEWTSVFAYAEDGMASIAYTLRAMLTGDSKNVLWAAQAAYEAVDQYVLDTMDIKDIGEEEERMVLQNPVVQMELTRQERDLRELAALSVSNVPGLYKELIKRAQHESALPY